MAVIGQEALKRRLEDEEDELQPQTTSGTPLTAPNGQQAIQARGNVVYQGGLPAANNQQNQMASAQAPVFGGQQGQFQADKMPTGYDFNASFEAGVNQLNKQRAQVGNQRDSILRRLGEDYARFDQGLDRQHERVLQQNMQNMADRGMVHSGANIGEQADIGEEYTRQQDLASMTRARQEEDTQTQYATAIEQLQGMMQDLERNRAVAQEEADRRRAEEEAEAKAREEALQAEKEEAARLEQERLDAERRHQEQLAAARATPDTRGRYTGGAGGGMPQMGWTPPETKDPRRITGQLDAAPGDLRTIADLQTNQGNVVDFNDYNTYTQLLKALDPAHQNYARDNRSAIERRLRSGGDNFVV